MERNNVLRVLAEHKGELQNAFGVKSLALFGSVARNQASSDSDIDLLVEFNRPTGLFGLFALQNHLEYLLGCKVDLGTPNGLKPRVRDRILAEQIDAL